MKENCNCNNDCGENCKCKNQKGEEIMTEKNEKEIRQEETVDVIKTDLSDEEEFYGDDPDDMELPTPTDMVAELLEILSSIAKGEVEFFKKEQDEGNMNTWVNIKDSAEMWYDKLVGLDYIVAKVE